jgi:DNA-directed RNA polymerase specialized sigma24 family protein
MKDIETKRPPSNTPRKVPPVKADSDRIFVARLIAGDSDAWTAVKRDIVTPLFRANIKGIAQRCEPASINADAVFSRLYVNLSQNDFRPLRNFRHDSAFSSWLYQCIRTAGREAITEIKGGHLERKLTLPKPIEEEAHPDRKPSPAEAAAIADDVEEANRLLAKLWERNPIYALVLVLCNDVKLSAEETGTLLGKTPLNVYQINHRAQIQLRAFRDEHSRNP